MNKKELRKAIIELPVDCSGLRPKIDQLTTLGLVKLLDEPETGNADEAPRYVKNILARLRELPVHDREVWLKAIIDEFEQDFSRAKWREGYEQGKFEGKYIPEKVKVPQFVAGWIANVKRNGFKFRNSSGFYEEIVSSDDAYRVMYYILKESIAGEAIRIWVNANRDVFARAWLYGYEVEKEPKYTVKIKATKHYFAKYGNGRIYFSLKYESAFTKIELEKANLGWVFDCEGIEIEEVEE